MGRQVTLKFGFAGDVRDVTVVLLDGEPLPWQWGEQFSVLRKETPRVDGPLKATGSARYSYDIQMPGMLYGAILRSPYAHAMVRSVDLSGARQQSGVIAALRVEDNEVRFAGQEVAAVAAVSPEVATHALRHIKVEYTPLPFVVDMDKAMAAEAPKGFRQPPQPCRSSRHERRRCHARFQRSRRRSRGALHHAGADARLARDPRRGRELEGRRAYGLVLDPGCLHGAR
jgi:xanthine dehydrogenase molybdopterin-binding subunit B